MEAASSVWVSLPHADGTRGRHRTDPRRPQWTLCDQQIPADNRPVTPSQAGFPCALCSARFTVHLAPTGTAPPSTRTTPAPPQVRSEDTTPGQPGRGKRRERRRADHQQPSPARRRPTEHERRTAPSPRPATAAPTSPPSWHAPGWVILIDNPSSRTLHQPHPQLRLRAMCGRRFTATTTIWPRRPPAITLCRECCTIRTAALTGPQRTPWSAPRQRIAQGPAPRRLQVVRGGLPGLGRRR